MKHLLVALLLAVAIQTSAEDAPLDMNRVRSLVQRFKAGETLSPDDQTYLDRARQEMRKRAGQQKPDGGSASKRPAANPAEFSGLVPLTDLTGTYKGEDGGLYGGGRNEAPEAHQAAYLKESGQIRSLDSDGKPAGDGKIGLITIGFSNTNLESIDFKKTADADAQKNPSVVIVNGAIGSRSAVMWAWDGADVLSKAEQDRLDKEMDTVHMPKTNRRGSGQFGDKDTWPTLEQRVAGAGLKASQVQVLWLKHVEAVPRPLGEFPAHAKALQADMADILVIAKKRFPNLRVAYISSRTYAGWAGPNCGSPEPFAYESGYGVRWLIRSQINGDAGLNYDPSRGEVKAPLLMWGPYLWANSDSPRKVDGLVWSLADVRDDDHMHPSESGCKKVTAMLLNLLKTDRGARPWFVNASAKTPDAPQPSTATTAPAPPAPAPPPLDIGRAKNLMQRSKAGEILSAEDQAYLDRVRKEMLSKQKGKNANRAPIPIEPGVNDPKMLQTLVPLTEMSDLYKGEDAGLYGGGRNEPPAEQLAAARRESARITPLNAQGEPAADGKIAFLSIGLSNTTMEFSAFKIAVDQDPEKSPQVVVVDGAQGGRPAASWALSEAPQLPAGEAERLRKEIDTISDRMPKTWKSEWEVADERLQTAGVTPRQVQIIWLKEGVPNPGRFGEFPGHARAMQADITDMILIAKKHYPNLRMIYLSSRTFGGYAHDTRNPEPYAYENAFSVRWVIQEQIKGNPALNADPTRGPVTAPVLLWGPYLWTHGTTPRKSDGLVWELSDVMERDGMHPSPSGKKKVVAMLKAFFKTDPLARTWFVKS